MDLVAALDNGVFRADDANRTVTVAADFLRTVEMRAAGMGGRRSSLQETVRFGDAIIRVSAVGNPSPTTPG